MRFCRVYHATRVAALRSGCDCHVLWRMRVAVLHVCGRRTVNPAAIFPRFPRRSPHLIGVYIFANLAILRFGPAGLANSNRCCDCTRHCGKPAVARAVTFAILIRCSVQPIHCSNAPRVYYAMAKDGLFFRRLAEYTALRTPAFAVAATAFGVGASCDRTSNNCSLMSYSLDGCSTRCRSDDLVYRKRETGDSRNTEFRYPGRQRYSLPWSPHLC